MKTDFPYKLEWKVEIPNKAKTKSKVKKYEEHTAWFPHENTREKHISRIKREGAKFIKKSLNRGE
jgi:hypothetical protein